MFIFLIFMDDLKIKFRYFILINYKNIIIFWVDYIILLFTFFNKYIKSKVIIYLKGRMSNSQEIIIQNLNRNITKYKNMYTNLI